MSVCVCKFQGGKNIIYAPCLAFDLQCMYLLTQVEEVRTLKEELMRQARLTVEQKLQRAEEKRQLHLKETAQKAHEERAKVSQRLMHAVIFNSLISQPTFDGFS